MSKKRKAFFDKLSACNSESIARLLESKSKSIDETLRDEIYSGLERLGYGTNEESLDTVMRLQVKTYNSSKKNQVWFYIEDALGAEPLVGFDYERLKVIKPKNI
jgi:hypothetical protein